MVLASPESSAACSTADLQKHQVIHKLFIAQECFISNGQTSHF